jgi:3-hydroxyisobutyrate dehydrogenase
MVELKGRKILNRDFDPQFMAKLMHKDVKLATRLAESLNIPMPVLAAVKEQFQTAISLGYGNEDMCAVIKNYEQWADIEVSPGINESSI